MKITDKISRIVEGLPGFFKTLPGRFKHFWIATKEVLNFLFFFFLFISNKLFSSLSTRKRVPTPLKSFFEHLSKRLINLSIRFDKEGQQDGRMKKFEIFELSFKTMSSKKTRSLVTIGGMAIGVGAIVFLVSIGFGLQKLVINRVARLEELKQADVSVSPGSNVSLDDSAVLAFNDIDGVEKTLPLIGVAAQIDFNGSKSDVAAYGAETEYLKRSAVSTSSGKLFNTDSANFDPYEYVTNYEEVEETTESTESVQGVSDYRSNHGFGDVVGPIKFSIYPRSWVEVRSSPSSNSELIGYTRQVEGMSEGEEVFGESYSTSATGATVKGSDGYYLGRWASAPFYIWEKTECGDEFGCEKQTFMPIFDEYGRKKQVEGYIDESEVIVLSGGWVDESVDAGQPAVLGLQSVDDPELSYTLGESTDSAALTSLGIDEDDVTWLSKILNINEGGNQKELKKVTMHPNAQREALINTSVLKILDMEKGEALGQKFNIAFIATSDLLDGNRDKLESEYIEYTIVGVLADESTPFVYVPINDLKSLGIRKYSQAKVIAENENDLAEVRKKIEALGFVTDSVADTVAQINRLFGTTRLLLGVVGSIALGVAAFGMFNTLTVSLLERTREVGLMKAMGMTSDEIRRLFLTESLLMGFLGGIVGIFLGFTAGQLVSIVLSIFSITKGIGFLNISALPLTFVLLVFFLSLVVGLVTGLYPSKRATKISALDALRYE